MSERLLTAAELAERSHLGQVPPAENARARERDPDKPEAEREPKHHHGRKIRETGDLGHQSCDAQRQGSRRWFAHRSSRRNAAARTSGAASLVGSPRMKPIPWISPCVVASAPSGSMLPAPRRTHATAAMERRAIPGDSSLGTRQRSVKGECKRADTRGTREEGHVHQPPVVTQRVFADRVAVVDLRLQRARGGLRPT